jgi:hypothetical protein
VVCAHAIVLPELYRLQKGTAYAHITLPAAFVWTAGFVSYSVPEKPLAETGEATRVLLKSKPFIARRHQNAGAVEASL